MNRIRFSFKKNIAVSLIFALIMNPLSSAWGVILREGEDQRKRLTTVQILDLNKVAEQNGVEAAQANYTLGEHCYYYDEDPENAIHYFQRAAGFEHVNANYELGKLFFEKKENQEKAITYLSKAVELGHPEAQNYLQRILATELQEKLGQENAIQKFVSDVQDGLEKELEKEKKKLRNTKKKRRKKNSKFLTQQTQKLREVQEILETVVANAEISPVLVVPSPQKVNEAFNNALKEAAEKVYAEKELENNEVFTPPFSREKEDQPPENFKKLDVFNEQGINAFLQRISRTMQEELASNDKENLYHISLSLQRNLESINALFYEQNPKNIIVLVGSTHAGKSTLSHWLADQMMPVVHNEEDLGSFTFQDTEEISGGIRSKTKQPKLYPAFSLGEDTFFGDCPGFHDTRGVLQEIENFFYIQHLFKNRNVKFLLAIPERAFDYSVARGQLVVDAFKNLKGILKNPACLPPSVSLVVTHYQRKSPSLKGIQEQPSASGWGISSWLPLSSFFASSDTPMRSFEKEEVLLEKIKNKVRELSIAQKNDRELKHLMLSVAENNKIAFFSRPPILMNDYQIHPQSQSEKSALHDVLKSTEYLALKEEDLNFSPSYPEIRLLLNQILNNLIERIDELFKPYAQNIDQYFSEKREGFKEQVDLCVAQGMKYYTPLALITGPDKESEAIYDSAINQKIISHNTSSRPLIIGGGVIGSVLGAVAIPLLTPLISPLIGASVLGGMTSIGSYWFRKDSWKRELTNEFKTREGDKLKGELYTCIVALQTLRECVLQNNFETELSFNRKFDETLNISGIQSTSHLLHFIYTLQGRKDLPHKIWGNTCHRVAKTLMKQFFQTPTKFYQTVMVPEKIEPLSCDKFLDVFIDSILLRDMKAKNLPLVQTEIIKNLLTEYLEEPHKTAFLPEKKASQLIHYMTLCKTIYTDFRKSFSSLQLSPQIMQFYKEILDKTEEGENIYRNLLNVQNESNAVSKKSIYTHPLEEKYKSCLEQINIFLTKVNKEPFAYQKLSDIQNIRSQLEVIRDEIHQEFSWHFGEKSGGFADIWKDGKNFPLTPQSVVALSFLEQAQLLQSPNISILDVGFRHLNRMKGIFQDVEEKKLEYQHNPQVLFNDSKEIDYIAYIERSISKKSVKDKLNIVYSGSRILENWRTDVAIGEFLDCAMHEENSLAVHQGISSLFFETEGYYNLIRQIKNYYKTHSKPQYFKVVTTGHSLGGALALLGAYYTKCDTKNLSEILKIKKNNISVKTFTFAPPPFMDEVSRHKVEKMLGKKNIQRVWNYKDSVISLTTQPAFDVGKTLPLFEVNPNYFRNIGRNIFNFCGFHSAKLYLHHLKNLENSSGATKEFLNFLDGHAPNLWKFYILGLDLELFKAA